jgi:TPR repeat protein
MEKSAGATRLMITDDQLQKGINAFMGLRFEEAVNFLLPLAEQGDVEAQKLMARLYFSGNGVEKSLEKYQYWLHKAADQGDRQSKVKLKRINKK